MVQADERRGFRHAITLHDRVAHTPEKFFSLGGERRAAGNEGPEFPAKSPVNAPEAPCPPQKFLAICGVEVVLQPVALAARGKIACEPGMQSIEHSRHRNERRGPL